MTSHRLRLIAHTPSLPASPTPAQLRQHIADTAMSAAEYVTRMAQWNEQNAVCNSNLDEPRKA